MNASIAFAAAVTALAVIWLLARALVPVYVKFRGKRVITCPETGEPAAVEVDARRAAVSAVFGDARLRLQECSRWPERQGCGQQCLRQVEAAPADCLVRTIFAKWYAGKTCVLCAKPIDEINLLTHQPALMDVEGRTVAWHEFEPERISHVLATHQPVCWSCHIAEKFRREYPELVVDRPEH